MNGAGSRLDGQSFAHGRAKRFRRGSAAAAERHWRSPSGGRGKWRRSGDRGAGGRAWRVRVPLQRLFAHRLRCGGGARLGRRSIWDDGVRARLAIAILVGVPP